MRQHLPTIVMQSIGASKTTQPATGDEKGSTSSTANTKDHQHRQHVDTVEANTVANRGVVELLATSVDVATTTPEFAAQNHDNHLDHAISKGSTMKTQMKMNLSSQQLHTRSRKIGM